MKKIGVIHFAVLLSVGGFLIIFYPFILSDIQKSQLSLSDYGDFVGGVAGSLFSLAGFILLYKTLKESQKALKKQEEDIISQKKIYEYQSFETTFFNLINVQHSITTNIKAEFCFINSDGNKDRIEVTGYEFFYWAIKTRDLINKSLSQDMYRGQYPSENEKSQSDYHFELRFDQNSSEYDCHAEEEIERKKYNEDFAIKLINTCFLITQDKWEKGHFINDKERIEYVYNILFSKYHFAIGHYFRHLYHIMKFVCLFEESQKRKENSDRCDIEIKCNQYAQFIQAQLSAFELALLHDNAISFEKVADLIKKYDLLENASLDYLTYKKNYLRR